MLRFLYKSNVTTRRESMVNSNLHNILNTVSLESQYDAQAKKVLAQKIVLAGNPKDEDVTPITEDFEVQEHGFDYTLPSYSFTVIRIGQKMDK